MDDTEEKIHWNKENIISLILIIISFFADLGLFIFYNKEQSLYFSLLNLMSLFEISFLFSKFCSEFALSKQLKLGSILNGISFWKIDYDSLFGKDTKISFYFAMRILYIFLNICFFIETIKLINRPFSQSKKSTNLYLILSALLLILVFCLQKYVNLNEKKKEGLVKFLFHCIIDIIFVITSFISIIFVIKRFCWKKPLIQSSKNLFVLRHFTYIAILIIYLGIELKYHYDSLDTPDNNTKTTTINYINCIIYSLGLVMSLIKISDLIVFRLNKMKNNKKGVTSMISSNLNVEFMCCILYGMTDIFFKNQNENSFSFLKNKKSIVHTIKYNNTIDSYNYADMNDIDIHVSIKKSLINPEENDLNSEKTISNSNQNEEDSLIIEYLPEIFNNLRKNDNIDDNIMIKAFSPSKNKKAINKMSESKGKSGSFFFYSHDRKFIIKTIIEEERETLLNIINTYYNYVKEHKETLITKIYGVYTVVIKNASSVNIILMQNLFGCSPIHIQRMFDLKGSTIGRKTKDVQNWKKDQVLKDLDYEWLTKIERKLINFKEDDIKEIKNNLTKDINFYKNLGLMDYSLLFIIIDFPNKIDPDYNQIVGLLDDPKYRGHVYKSNDKKFLYIIGIIDYLQIFNCKKRLENFFKGIYYGKEKNMISAVESHYYGDRFFNFMAEKVFIVGEKDV